MVIDFVEDLGYIADAEYLGGRKGHIRIESKIWNSMSSEQQTELIIHEMCHIALDYKYPKIDYPDHGNRWRLFMKVSGIPSPRALMQID